MGDREKNKNSLFNPFFRGGQPFLNPEPAAKKETTGNYSQL